MLIVKPDYYDQFKCINKDCTDTCCSGWQIVIDEKHLKKYRLKDAFPSVNMGKYINFRKKVFKQKENRRCAFLTDENLCILCRDYGEDALSRTCHLYPRHIEEFENVREITLSLSCPEVASIVLNKTTPAKFIESSNDEYEEYDDFDFMLYSSLCTAREIMINVVQNRNLPFDVRAGMVLGLSFDIDKRLCDNRFFTVDELLDYVKTKEAETISESKVNNFLSDKKRVYEFMYKKYKRLFKLEPISYDWINLYTETEHILYKKGQEYYTEKSAEFDAYITQSKGKDSGISFDFNIMLEQILVYFIYTYFCGAVYDGNVYGKGKLAVYSVYYIREILKATYIKNDGLLTVDEIEDVTMRFSRELEHSDINLGRIEKF